MNNYTTTLQYILDRFSPSIYQTYPIALKGLTREDLASLFYELGYKQGAEIGVAKGIFSRILCEKNPGLESLICVDLWRDEKMYEEAIRTLDGLPCTLVRNSSLEASKQVKDGSLDFVYIDAKHSLPQVTQDIEIWSPKVRVGGIVSGHDYKINIRRNFGVVEAVDSYISANKISHLFTVGGNAPARRWPSWFFCKGA